MAKGRTKFPIDSMKGTLSGVDRTIGRNPGFVALFKGRAHAPVHPGQGKYSTGIAANKAPTRGGSASRHTRAEVYCGCDAAYALLTTEKQWKLKPWWRAVMNQPDSPMDPYHIYMKICLKMMAECSAFTRFSWVSRYVVKNETSSLWTNHQVILKNYLTFQPDGQDVEVYKLLALTTKKGNQTFSPWMIDYRLTHETTTPGRALVTIPDLAPNCGMVVDVYSYYLPGGS